MPRFVDLTGQRFDRLIVLSRAENQGKYSCWNCLCDCGSYKVVRACNLKSKQTKSCGCLVKEKFVNKAHGQYKTRLYNIWRGIKKRCLVKTQKAYKNYGGRGITICNEWKDNFQAFYDWALNNGYKEDLSIDRIDNDRNYEPNNCRWVDRVTQSNNKRNNHYIEKDNEKHTLTEWCQILGISRSTIKNRIKKNWSEDKLLIAPTKKGGK